MKRLRRLRVWLFGERARSWFNEGGVYFWTSGRPPLWRRLRKPKPLGPEWREVGYTTED